ncbi:unnamed protein product [Symbiodinium natans]|uniref:Uncharacterized protein n=1 Tax=Symbiodinium natans TaxID=878477 RepID=A0A812V7D6_9DINO|nr:unnamed protein product [Symbiodinium natans]
MATGSRAWRPRPSERHRMWQAGFARRRLERQEMSPVATEGQMVAADSGADHGFSDNFFETSLRAYAERQQARLWPALPAASSAPLLERRAGLAGRGTSIEPRTPNRPPKWGQLHSPPKHSGRRRIAEARWQVQEEDACRRWSPRSDEEGRYGRSPPAGWPRKRLRSEERSPSRDLWTPVACAARRTPPSRVAPSFEGAPRPAAGGACADLFTPPRRIAKAFVRPRTGPPQSLRSSRRDFGRREEANIPRSGTIVFEGNPFRTVRRRLLDDWDEEEEAETAPKIEEVPDSPEASGPLAIEFLHASG